jgi:hypothetical protein
LRAYKFFVRSTSGVLYPKVPQGAQSAYPDGIVGDPHLQEVIVLAPERWEHLDLGIGMTGLSGTSAFFNFYTRDFTNGAPAKVIDLEGQGALKLSPLKEVQDHAELEVSYAPGAGGSAFRGQRVRWWAALGTVAPSTNNWESVTGRRVERRDRPDGGFDARYEFRTAPIKMVTLCCVHERYESAEYRKVSLQPGKQTSVVVRPLTPAEAEDAPKR